MGFWTFVFAISALGITAGIITTWIKAKHGYPISDGKCGRERRHGSAQFDAIEAENRALKEKLSEVTERLAVLERIATDPAERVSREIELLR